VLQHGVKSLTSIASPDNLDTYRALIRTMFALVKENPPYQLVQPILPFLANSLYIVDEEALGVACRGFAELTKEGDQQRMAVNSGMCRRMVELMM